MKRKKMLTRLKQWAQKFKNSIYALYLAYRRQDVKFIVKILAMIIVAYALSPIDLIPDFIPVIGYLDDLILLPLGIAFVIKMIPQVVWDKCVEKAKGYSISTLPRSKTAGIFVLIIWSVGVWIVWHAFF